MVQSTNIVASTTWTADNWGNNPTPTFPYNDKADAIGALSCVIELGGGDRLTSGLLGCSYSSIEQYVHAESAYGSAVPLEPDVLDWKLGLTMSVLKQQRYGEAATLCGELLDGYPVRADYWLLQANAYIGLGKPLEAAKNFEAEAKIRHAQLLVDQSRYQEAIPLLKRAQKSKPREDVARFLEQIERVARTRH